MRNDSMEQNLSILKNIVLFKDFKDNVKVLQKINKLFTEMKAKKGGVIIEEGKEGDELFIIKNGSVRIVKNTREIGLLLNDKRSATVVAEEDCTFLVTNRKKFISFGEKEPYIALLISRQIAQILSKRLYKTNQDVVTLFSALVDEIDSEGMLY
jgi:CRP-like cAMP-binding protein